MNIYDIWFSYVKLPNEMKNEMLEQFNSTEELWNYAKRIGSFKSNTVKNALISAMDLKRLNMAEKIILENGIKVISLTDEYYPDKLKFFPDSPYLLYYYGDIEKINKLKAVAIVGSRNCTIYGSDAARNISSVLSQYSVNIISGMAKGIDSAAHWAAVKNEGFTTAIMGCGLDKIYPLKNKSLFEKIKDLGCIISEFPPGTPPFAYNFPVRNRIISGLSDLVIIVEAEEKSGSLITAGRAADQGKSVMAVPGSIFSKNSKGTNELIKDGADIFIDADQLLDTLKIVSIEKKGNDKSNNEHNDVKRDAIYNLLTDTPTHIDDIIRITNIDISILYELLLEMQLEDTIRCIAGNYYVRINNKI